MKSFKYSGSNKAIIAMIDLVSEHGYKIFLADVNEIENSCFDDIRGCIYIRVDQNDDSTVAHEVGHAIFDMTGVEFAKEFKASVEYCVNNVNTSELDAPGDITAIQDAYSILKGEPLFLCRMHSKGYGSNNPLYFAATEAFAEIISAAALGFHSLGMARPERMVMDLLSKF